eukprot:1338366-Pyramimonas_sp.AAC.2
MTVLLGSRHPVSPIMDLFCGKGVQGGGFGIGHDRRCFRRFRLLLALVATQNPTRSPTGNMEYPPR